LTRIKGSSEARRKVIQNVFVLQGTNMNRVMGEVQRFGVELEQQEGFEFRVSFDWPGVAQLTLDEPEPLGKRRGPNAARLVAAAVANCLAASLVFCLKASSARIRDQYARWRPVAWSATNADATASPASTSCCRFRRSSGIFAPFMFLPLPARAIYLTRRRPF